MLIPILTMSIMGLLFGLGLAYASKIFRVKIDPKIDMIMHALPGSNCGACGKAGCAGLAEAIAKGDYSLTSCSAGGVEVYAKIAEVLGVEKEVVIERIARVRCGGGKRAKDKYKYEGVETCAAVSLVAGGQKLCQYACVGFADCVRACPFDAIHMGENEIPVVDPEKCTACGKCVTACPKDIISLENIEEKYFVKCLSKDKASFVKEVCEVGCIACRICEKLSKGAFIVEDNLSKLDYKKVDASTPLELCVEKCPTKCIISGGISSKK